MKFEADIEKAFCSYAISQDCHALKLVLLGGRGWPDRTIICPGGSVLFIEFKRPGGKLSARQRFWFNLLISLGFECHVIEDFETARRALDQFLAGIAE